MDGLKWNAAQTKCRAFYERVYKLQLMELMFFFLPLFNRVCSINRSKEIRTTGFTLAK